MGLRSESECRDVGGQCRFVICDFALRRTMLAENPAGPSFGHAQFCGDMIHTRTAAGGAWKFPLAASARIIVQSQIRNCPAEASVLGLQFLQAFHLIALQAAVFCPPTIICNFRYAYRPDRLRRRFAMRIQHVNLTKLHDDLFCLVSFRCHFNVLLRLISHTSRRITFQGADHSQGARICKSLCSQAPQNETHTPPRYTAPSTCHQSRFTRSRRSAFAAATGDQSSISPRESPTHLPVTEPSMWMSMSKGRLRVAIAASTRSRS